MTSPRTKIAVALALLIASAQLALAQSGTWINTAGGSWPTAGNWNGGMVADGADNTADFSTLDITADATVTLDGTRTIGNLTFGDTTPSNNWILNTGGGGPLTLDVTSGNPTITVNNQTATMGVALVGTDGLVKAGAGTLAISAQSTYSGGTTVNAGILDLTGGASSGQGVIRGTATVNSGGTLQLA